MSYKCMFSSTYSALPSNRIHSTPIRIHYWHIKHSLYITLSSSSHHTLITVACIYTIYTYIYTPYIHTYTIYTQRSTRHTIPTPPVYFIYYWYMSLPLFNPTFTYTV